MCVRDSQKAESLCEISMEDTCEVRASPQGRIMMDEKQLASQAIAQCLRGSDIDHVVLPASDPCPPTKDGNRIKIAPVVVEGLSEVMAKNYQVIWQYLRLTLWKPTTGGAN